HCIHYQIFKKPSRILNFLSGKFFTLCCVFNFLSCAAFPPSGKSFAQACVNSAQAGKCFAQDRNYFALTEILFAIGEKGSAPYCFYQKPHFSTSPSSLRKDR
ncbi:hypothetical protein MWN41_12630, partial [Ornithobacterium rhinotracheale]|uniref:hypothetical protein n=1 Tax=Ornithobacterium rhinotracheale TaxID=28251 RepID=UPI001FF5BF5E